MSRISRLLTVGLVALVAVSCRTRHFGDGAKVKHAEGTAGVAPNGALWFPFYPDLSILMKQGELRTLYRGEFTYALAESKPELKRLQTWLDALYDRATDTAWFQRTGRKPLRPKVVVIGWNEVQAFVHSGILAYPMRIVHIPDSLPEEKKAKLRALAAQELPPNSRGANFAQVGPDGGLSFGYGGDEEFVADASRVNDFVAYQRTVARRMGSPCYIPPESTTPPFALSPACQEGGVAVGAELTTTMPYIFVHSALIEQFGEEEVVGVMAHELGHYLYGHPTQKTFLYGVKQSAAAGVPAGQMAGNDRLRAGYYYIEDLRKPSAIPVPISDAALVTRAQAALRDTEAAEYLKAPGESIDASVVAELRDISSVSFYESEIDLSWSIALEKALSRLCKARLGESGCAPLRHSFELWRSEKPYWSDSTYNAGLDVLRTVAAGVAVKDGESCKNLMAPSPLLCGTVFQYAAFLGEAWRQLAASPNVTLLNVIDKAGKLAEEARVRGTAGREWLIKNRIGWYTPEQQADEFMTEIVIKNGIDPWLMVERYVNKHEERRLLAAQQYRAANVSNDLMALDCRKLADAKFRDGAGNLIPMGQTLGSDWGDIHHSGCYRAYNIVRELAVLHDYKLGTSPVAKDPAAWSALQKSLATVLK
jgi:hypothetical protein